MLGPASCVLCVGSCVLCPTSCGLCPVSCILCPVLCPVLCLASGFSVSCRRKPLEPGSNARGISAAYYQSTSSPSNQPSNTGTQSRCLHLDVLLSRTHTTQDMCSCCVRLRKQVSRRNAPRARLRTGLDPTVLAVQLAPDPKRNSGVSQIDVMPVRPTEASKRQAL